jgi:hypothetical protein
MLLLKHLNIYDFKVGNRFSFFHFVNLMSTLMGSYTFILWMLWMFGIAMGRFWQR